KTDLNLAKLSDPELIRLQIDERNDWYARHARRILEERAAAGKLAADTHDQLRKCLAENRDVPKQLRAIWALHATGGLSESDLVKLTDHSSEYIRWWAIQFLVENKQPSEAVLQKFTAMAREDSSPMARLSLASALQRIPLPQRWKIAEGLVAHEEDAKDQNLPLMIWYGIEPL